MSFVPAAATASGVAPALAITSVNGSVALDVSFAKAASHLAAAEDSGGRVTANQSMNNKHLFHSHVTDVTLHFTNIH